MDKAEALELLTDLISAVEFAERGAPNNAARAAIYQTLVERGAQRLHALRDLLERCAEFEVRPEHVSS